MGGISPDRLFAGSTDPQIILEIGGNHEGDFGYARALVELACQSRAQIVKLQIYSADGLVNPRFDPNRHKHFQRFELLEAQYRELLEMIRAAGKKSCASIWSRSLYEALADEVDILKVGSGDLTNFLLTDLFVQSGKPVVLSSGLATLAEVDLVIARCRSLIGQDWASRIALLQCTTSYPCPPEHTHLAVIRQYLARFECAIGFSDHFEGSLASEVALDIGAQIFEFHFTDSREGKAFRDHKVSWTKDEVDRFVERIEIADKLLGGGEKTLTSYEEDQNYHLEFRKGLYYARQLLRGEVVSVGDLVSLRPSAQIEPSRYEEIVGKALVRDVEALGAVAADDFEAMK